MQEELYRKLLNQLKSCDKDYYLKNDATVFQKMKEAICYVLKYKSLPQKNVFFLCEPVSAIEWIAKVKNYPEPLYVAFSDFIMQYKRKVKGLTIWQFKYEYFRKYVLDCKKIPLAYEKSFFDGSDMRKWYNTQLYRLQEKTKPLNDYQKECLYALFEILKDFGITNKLMPVQPKENLLTNFEKLRVLYLFLLKNKKLPEQSVDKFLDGTSMITFYHQVCNQKVLNEKEQTFFNRLLFMIERYKKDKVVGKILYRNPSRKVLTTAVSSPKVVTSFIKNKPFSNCTIDLFEKPSMGSYLAYFRNKMHFKMKDMANILQMDLYHYINIENNHYVFSYFRRMQFKVLLDRYDAKDAVLLNMQKLINFSLQNENKFEYALSQLVAMLSLNIGKERKDAVLFSKKYRTIKDVLPNRHFSLSKKILLYKDLKTIESLSLFEDEKKIINSLLKILEKEILGDKSNEEILNKVNISLGLSCISCSSVYTLSLEETQHLIEIYENYRLRSNLTKEQMHYLDKCCYLLSCVLNPGQDISFEITRFLSLFDVSIQRVSKMLGYERSHLSHAIQKNSFSYNLLNRLIEVVKDFSMSEEDPNFLRFQDSLITFQKLKLIKKDNK